MTVNELALGCRSFRRFEQRPVPHSLLCDMVENARVSSSAANAQPLRYVVAEGAEAVAKMQPLVKWASFLPPEQGVPRPEERPVAFIVIAKAAGAGAFADVDVGIAAHAIALTAWESGVGSCMMGAINGAEIRRLLGIPEEDDVRLAIALGYPAHKSSLVSIREGGGTRYYLDADRNYCVPKRPFDDVVAFR